MNKFRYIDKKILCSYDLSEEFFKELGCDIIVSPETNLEILENGKKYSASEMCYH